MSIIFSVNISMVNIKKEIVIKTCRESKSITDAARNLKINYKTLRRLAKKFNCFTPNPSGRGTNKIKKENGLTKYRLKDILNGKHPIYQSYKLKIRLIKEKIKKDLKELIKIEERLREIRTERNILNNKLTNKLFGL